MQPKRDTRPCLDRQAEAMAQCYDAAQRDWGLWTSSPTPLLTRTCCDHSVSRSLVSVAAAPSCRKTKCHAANEEFDLDLLSKTLYTFESRISALRWYLWARTKKSNERRQAQSWFGTPTALRAGDYLPTGLVNHSAPSPTGKRKNTYC